MKTTTPFLKPGTIYSADNGRLICLECAGASAKFTGRDISGQKVRRIPRSENAFWRKTFGKDMACECGKTGYGMTFPKGAIVRLRPEWSEGNDELHVVVGEDKGKGRVDISPVNWEHGAIVPVETVTIEMIELVP